MKEVLWILFYLFRPVVLRCVEHQWEVLLIADYWALIPQSFWFRKIVWDGVWEFSFVTSSRVRLVLGPHSENHWFKPINAWIFLSIDINWHLNTKATSDTDHLTRIRFGFYTRLNKIIAGNFTLPLLTKSLDPGKPQVTLSPDVKSNSKY